MGPNEWRGGTVIDRDHRIDDAKWVQFFSDWLLPFHMGLPRDFYSIERSVFFEGPESHAPML